MCFAPSGRRNTLSRWTPLSARWMGHGARAMNRKIAVKGIDDRGNELMVLKGLDEAEPER